jgi:thiamine-phosphate pyrophosphorylase
VRIGAPIDAADEAVAEIARPLIAAAQARDIAALLDARPALALRLGADGVHLDGAGLDAEALVKLYRATRNALGEDAILGALCPPERHAAMEIAELDAAYVGFAGPDLDALIAWWGEMMTTPCVAFGSFTPETAAALARSGADFLAPGAEIWRESSALAALGAAIRAG